jgi:pyridoxine kinase
MKRVVTIQDISCFGKCSITVALPIISAMGIECAIIPTSILSTHTGGFKNFTFRDLNDDIPKIKDHWKQYNLKFDTIYTGYLGSPKQIEYVMDFIKDFRDKETLVFVDPAMEDKGKLYTGFNDEFPSHMAKLCSVADIVVPNITEASLMLGMEYKETYDEDYIKSLLKGLCKMGAKKAVITGVTYSPEKQGAVMYDPENETYISYFEENLPYNFHGTGDTFASVFAGALTKKMSYYDALKLAVDFTVQTIRVTIPDREKHFYATKFEECLPMLMK